MISLKYTVEMEIPDDVMEGIKKNIAGVTMDDIVRTRIESALLPICKGVIIVYTADEGRKPIDLYKNCPECGHAWVKHFDQTRKEQVGMSDGTTGIREVFTDPIPTYCLECAEMVPKGQFACREALNYNLLQQVRSYVGEYD